MKILVASGSFKDVYDPIEACEVIRQALNQDKNQVETQPICDGGEYTFDILKRYFGMSEITAENIVNTYHRKGNARYLVKGSEAHIVSSEILRLFPREDCYKNPLQLTDYGFGQLVWDALNRGYKDIILYIGGTSTVTCGMGFAQALGAKLYDKTGRRITKPVCGKDLTDIERIDPPPKKSDIRVRVAADGDAKSYEMSGITALKIGKDYYPQKQEIIEKTEQGIKHIRKITKTDPGMPFSGAAGGLRFGIDQVFDATYVLGGSYFSDLFSLEKKIEGAELVITGEGRLDNTACGKTPAYVAELAEKYHTPLFFICGQLAPGTVSSYAGGVVSAQEEVFLRRLGITKLITCQEFYDRNPLPHSYADQIERFKKQTPEALRLLFEKENM